MTSAGRLLISALLTALLTACASGPPDDGAEVPAPQSAAPVAPSSSVPPPPASASSAAAASDSDATLTPAERQARARQAAVQADQAAQQALQQQCSELHSEIREAQIGEQQAPSTSVSEPIVAAKEAHADQQIQRLQDQYDSLDCAAAEGPPSRTPLLPVPAAPNGLTPPGAQGVPSTP